MGLFGGRSTVARAPGERRSLTFIAPPIGSHIQAMNDYAAGTPEGALRVPAVWACIDKLAGTLGMLPAHAYRADSEGHLSRIGKDPSILTKPAAGATFSEWVYQAMVSLLLRGNAYGEIVARGNSGYPTQVELKHPDTVRVQLVDGAPEYTIGQRKLNPLDVWHMKAYTLPGAIVGMSPITYAAQTIHLPSAAEEFGLRFFTDGGHPSGLLTNTQAKVDQAQAKEVKAKFLAAVRGTREPVVMGSGWTYQPLSIAPSEAQFLEAQKWSVGQICRIFGVPPEMVGGASDGQSITYANVEERSLGFRAYSLQRWMKAFEDQLSMLIPGQQTVQFDDSQLVRTDTFTKWKVYHLQVAGRIRTPDEIRADEGQPPLTDEQKADLAALNSQGPPEVLPGPLAGT